MRNQSAVKRIEEALPLLRELISRLVNEQRFSSDYAGSVVELAESIQIVLGGGRVPASELIRASQAKRGGAL